MLQMQCKLKSSLAGTVMVTGPGAGGEPTASAVLADIFDFANKGKIYSFGRGRQMKLKIILKQNLI